MGKQAVANPHQLHLTVAMDTQAVAHLLQLLLTVAMVKVAVVSPHQPHRMAVMDRQAVAHLNLPRHIVVMVKEVATSSNHLQTTLLVAMVREVAIISSKQTHMDNPHPNIHQPIHMPQALYRHHKAPHMEHSHQLLLILSVQL